MRGGIGRGLALTLGAVVQAATSFGVQIVLMRLLVPEDFGRFALVLAGCSLVQTVLSWRLNVLIMRLPPGDQHSPAARLYQAGLVWETLAAALCTLVWLVLSGLISLYALVLVAALTLAQWGNQNIAFYERDMAYGRITLVETGSQMVGHGVALVLVLAGAGPIALYIRELSAIAVRIAAFARLGALLRPVLVWPRLNDLGQLWRESRAIWFEGVLEGSFARLVILVAGTLCGLHGAGIFAQSQRLAILPHQFMSPVISRFAVNLFNRTQSHQHRLALLLRLAAMAALVLMVAVGVTLLWGTVLVPWVFGPKWSEAGTTLQALAGLILFLPLFDLFRSYAYAQNRVGGIVAARLSQIASFAISAFFVFLAGPADAVGVGYALSAAYGVGFAVLLVGLFRRTGAGEAHA